MKSKMGKEKNKSAVDDLLDSLLEDIDNSQTGSSPEQSPDTPETPEGLPTNKNLAASALHGNDYDLEAHSEYNEGPGSRYEAEQRGYGDEVLWEKLDIPELPQHYQTVEEVFGKNGPPFEVAEADKQISQKFAAPNSIPQTSFSQKTEELRKEVQNKEVQNKHQPKHHAPANTQEETFALASEAGNAPLKNTGLPGASDVDPTIAVTAFAKKQKNHEPEEKVVVGTHRVSQKVGQVYTSVDASLAQAETLKFAQHRILQLEKDLERYRQENDELASAAEIIKARSDELENKLSVAEKEKNDLHDQFKSELSLLKGNLQHKETELGKARIKIDELDGRMKSDFKKIRTKERELENRLELARAEKHALMRVKDDNILELQRKNDQIKTELANIKSRVFELNKSSDNQNEQIRRTVRALRLALSSLEAKNDNIVPIKKAE